MAAHGYVEIQIKFVHFDKYNIIFHNILFVIYLTFIHYKVEKQNRHKTKQNKKLKKQ